MLFLSAPAYIEPGGAKQRGCELQSNLLEVLEHTEIADSNASGAETESGNGPGAFLQTPGPVLDRISWTYDRTTFIQFLAGLWQPERKSTIPLSAGTG